MDKKYYIDTHAHLNLSAFADDVDKVVQKCSDQGVVVINVGTKESTSSRAVELAEQYENLYAIVGLHPIQTTAEGHAEAELGRGRSLLTSQGEVFNKNFYRKLCQSKKVVAIGECGLDYYHNDPSTKDIQVAQFISQIELANELQLPLMIHTRNTKNNPNSSSSRQDLELDVHDDIYEILKHHAKVPGNIHFYAGNYTQAEKFFELGFTISFTGVITFAKDYEEVVRNAPLDLIHAETDCPYVAPKPYRGKRCEPWMVQEVYKKIAEIKGLDVEIVREQLLKNATKLYPSIRN